MYVYHCLHALYKFVIVVTGNPRNKLVEYIWYCVTYLKPLGILCKQNPVRYIGQRMVYIMNCDWNIITSTCNFSVT